MSNPPLQQGNISTKIEKLKRYLEAEFASFDKQKRGLVRPQDILEMIKIRTNNAPPIDLVASLVKRFDSQNKGALTFNEFCNLFLGYLNCVNGVGLDIQSLLAKV